MKTHVINVKKIPDYPMRNRYVYIGRGSQFGNPFRIGKDGNRAEVIEKYKKYFYNKLNNIQFKQAVHRLQGKKLGCFCKPLACHGDIIVEYLEGKNER